MLSHCIKRRMALVETDIKSDCSGVDWMKASKTLRCVGMI